MLRLLAGPRIELAPGLAQARRPCRRPAAVLVEGRDRPRVAAGKVGAYLFNPSDVDRLRDEHAATLRARLEAVEKRAAS